MPTSKFHRWTEDEERRLLELRQAGKSNRLIAKILSRTEVAVANRLELLRKKGIIGDAEEQG
jgi:hypothetical protein